MIIHKVVQGTPEWHALRAKCRTASEASAMMGASKKTSRSELVRMKATGSEKEFSAWVQKNLLDKGHVIEAAARSIAENIAGADLYPCTATSEEHEWMLASFDGVTMFEDVVSECKSWNEQKAAEVREGRVPEEDKWQLVQQLVVSRAGKCLYMVTDGTEERTVYCWFELTVRDEQALLAGWKQFDEDVAAYQHVETAPALVGEAVKDLPTVFVKVSGEIAVQNNFDQFDKALKFFISEVLIKDPKTDKDFVDLDLQIKALKKAEDALDNAEAQMLAQVQEINDLTTTKTMLRELARQHRLMSEKLLTTQKEAIKRDIRQGAIQAWQEHVAKINNRLSPVTVPGSVPDFATAMKNKRTIDSLRDAVDTLLAKSKIEINAIAEQYSENLATLREKAAEYKFLFRDVQDLVQKDAETLGLLIKQRIDDYEQSERERLDAERERIRQEEQARLEREAQEARDREERERQTKEEAKSPVANEQEAAPQANSAGEPVKQNANVDPVPDDKRQTDLLDAAPEPVIPHKQHAERLEVIDMLELVKAVSRGEAPLSILSVDLLELAEACNAKGHSFPGVRWSKA